MFTKWEKSSLRHCSVNEKNCRDGINPGAESNPRLKGPCRRATGALHLDQDRRPGRLFFRGRKPRRPEPNFTASRPLRSFFLPLGKGEQCPGERSGSARCRAPFGEGVPTNGVARRGWESVGDGGGCLSGHPVGA